MFAPLQRASGSPSPQPVQAQEPEGRDAGESTRGLASESVVTVP